MRKVAALMLQTSRRHVLRQPPAAIHCQQRHSNRLSQVRRRSGDQLRQTVIFCPISSISVLCVSHNTAQLCPAGLLMTEHLSAPCRLLPTSMQCMLHRGANCTCDLYLSHHNTKLGQRRRLKPLHGGLS